MAFIGTKVELRLKTCFVLLIALIFASSAFQLITLTAWPFIIILYGCAFSYVRTRGIIQKIALIALSLLALAFSLHIIPGFKPELLFYREPFGLSNFPYKLNANLDKALAGFAILVALGQKESWCVSTKTLTQILYVAFVLFAFSFLLGAQLDPKFGQLTFAFIFFNLFVTCIAEEAFFRLVIQNSIHKISKGLIGGWLAVLITALVFMLAHFHTGEGATQRLLLIFIAGIIYGGIYLKSKCFGSAVLAHFSINMIYFSFFTFPATFN